MSRFLVFCLVGLGLALSAHGAELSFFSPDFSTASVETLRTRSQLAGEAGALALLFLADRESAEGRIHAALADYRALHQTCELWESTDYRGLEVGRAAMICALAETEILARGDVFDRWSHGDSLRRARARAFSAKAPVEERQYFEGRLFAALSPALGQDFRKALLSLRFAQAQHPEDGSVAYWTAKAFERQGNAAKAKELYAEAAAKRSPLALAVQKRSETSSAREADGLRYGIGLGVFSSPATGIGGELSYKDERAFDTARLLGIGGWLTTRRQAGLNGAFIDEASLEPAVLRLRGAFRDGVEDFFGFGMSSAGTASVLSVRRSEVAISAFYPLSEAIGMTVGWRVTSAEQTDSGAPTLTFASHNGAFGEIAYDSRDSRTDPASGALLRVLGYFPTTFKVWKGEAIGYWRLGLRHKLIARVGASVVDKVAPFSEYPDLARDLSLPGVREFRYRDRELYGGALEYQWHFLPLVSGALFGSVGHSTSDAANRGGGGLALIGHFLRDRSANPRFELAYFGGELVAQGIVRASF